MSNLTPNNGIYLKLISLFTADQKKTLSNLSLNSIDRAVFAAKVFQQATGDKMENVIDLIFGKGAYAANKEEIDGLLA